MNHVDYGLAILSAKVLAGLPAERAFDLADIYRDLSLRDQLAGYEVGERFYEIGSHQGLQEAIEYFSNLEHQ